MDELEAEVADGTASSDSGGCPFPRSNDAGIDILDPGYLADPYATWAELRKTRPVTYSSLWGGAWIPVSFETVKEISKRPEDFSSRALEVTGPIPPKGKGLRVPPLSSDPPEHASHRRLLMPFFTKSAVAGWEARIRSVARHSLDNMSGAARVDAATAYAGHVPMQITLEMLGVDPQDASHLEGMVEQLLRSGPRDIAEREKAARGLIGYFREVLPSKDPESSQYDLLGHLWALRKDNPTIDEERILGMSFLLLVAGIDTTWAVLSSSLLHLATHHEDRDRLVNDPQLLSSAVEEFLRAFSPVSNARVTTGPVDIHGLDIPANQRVILPLAAANRDPSAFPEPDRVLLDRSPNSHIAFGIGIHRCLGSHLARLELRIALEEWLSRYPRFFLDTGVEIGYWGGQVRGPANVPVVLEGAP